MLTQWNPKQGVWPGLAGIIKWEIQTQANHNKYLEAYKCSRRIQFSVSLFRAQELLEIVLVGCEVLFKACPICIAFIWQYPESWKIVFKLPVTCSVAPIQTQKIYSSKMIYNLRNSKVQTCNAFTRYFGVSFVLAILCLNSRGSRASLKIYGLLSNNWIPSILRKIY